VTRLRRVAEMLERFFRKIRPGRIAFEDGSYIEFLNREAVLYAEADGHRMEVVWYFQPGRMTGRVLRTSDIGYWDPPHETENLSAEKKMKIIEYCRKRSIPIQIKDE
jgi:hypothetical protein